MRCRANGIPGTFCSIPFETEDVTMSLDILELLRRINAVCVTLSSLTTNSIDDRLTAAVAVILKNDAFLHLLSLLFQEQSVTNSLGTARTEAIVQLATASAPAESEATLRAAGMSWREFLQLLPIIVRIGLTLLGKR
jgi:hypothetical protein